MTENEITVLEKLNTAVTADHSAELQPIKESNPIAEVESSLSTFSQDVFQLVKDEFIFQNKLEKEIERRLGLPENQGGFTNNQILLLHNNNSVALNDKISKALGPTFQLMTAKQQAEIAAKSAETRAAVQIAVNNGGSQESMKNLNSSENTSQEILQGLNTLQNLLNAALTTGNSKKDI